MSTQFIRSAVSSHRGLLVLLLVLLFLLPLILFLLLPTFILLCIVFVRFRFLPFLLLLGGRLLLLVLLLRLVLLFGSTAATSRGRAPDKCQALLKLLNALGELVFHLSELVIDGLQGIALACHLSFSLFFVALIRLFDLRLKPLDLL